jgi:hypothetical protein
MENPMKTSWSLAIALIGAVLAQGCGGGGSPTPAAAPAASVGQADISVKVEGPSEVTGGTGGRYVASVTNVGSATATDVPVALTVNGSTGTPSFACAASGGAACPASVAMRMTIPSLPPGGTLSFTMTFHVSWPPSPTRDVSVHIASSTAGDPRTDNDAARVFTVVGSPWSGRFTLFGTDARQYTLDLDRDVFRYTLSGEGLAESAVLQGEMDGTRVARIPTGPESASPSKLRLRLGPDLVAGSLTRSDGEIVPFVGVRRFVETIGELPTGDISIIGRFAPLYAVRSARFGGGRMQLCVSMYQESMDDCPLASIITYDLSMDAGEILGVAPDRSTLRFRIARIGDAFVYLQSERSADNKSAFWIGLRAVARPAAVGSVRTIVGATTDEGPLTASMTATDDTGRTHVFRATGALAEWPTDMTFNGTATVPGVHYGLSDSLQLVTLLDHPLLSVTVTTRPKVEMGIFAP